MQNRIRHRRVQVGSHDVFYREGGDPGRPTLLLLHGFPSSSHMFRDLLPRLADRFHVVAPDLPGFGLTRSPGRDAFAYTFDNLAAVIEDFTQALSLDCYALYVFDYGAPVGFRLALKNPQRITALITQNGNAYEVGLSDGWTPIRAYWQKPDEANRAALRQMLTAEFTKMQYVHGTGDESLVAPDGYLLDTYFIGRPGNDEIQLDLFRDYAGNVALYPTFQRYFAAHRPPLLAVWGRNDPFFLPPGAKAFRRDIPEAEVHFFDTGHFALETHAAEIADKIRDFLERVANRRAAA